VTTDNTDITADLDQDQSQLDAAQGGSQESQAAPGVGETNEIQAIRQLADQVTALRKDVKDSQSKFDKGLNSFRARQDEADRRALEAQRKQEEQVIQQYVETIPEEYKAQFEELDRRRRQAEEQLYQVQNQGNAQSEEEQAYWARIQGYVKNMGIDPQTPGIDYAAWSDPSLTEDQKAERFFQSIGRINKNGTEPQPTPSTTSGDSSEVQSPPTGGNPSGGGSNNLRTERQITDAYLNDTITHSDYKKRLAALGRRI